MSKSKSSKHSSSERLEFDVADKNIRKYFSQIEDWALQQDDELQSFEEFLHMERYPVTKKRRTIYLIPIGDLGSIHNPQEKSEGILSIHNLVLFCKTYFCMECSVLEGLTITQDEDGFYLVPPHDKSFLYPIRTVISKDYPGVVRLHALDILRVLQEMLPADGFCVFGVTLSDLYEHHSKRDKEDSPVLGRATGDRVGVISLFRFDPNLQNRDTKPSQANRKRTANNDNNNNNHTTTIDNCTKDQLKKWYLRMIKTVAHELMHTMGLDHCVSMACVMNGCVAPDHVLENLTESEKECMDPIFLCPLDLKKLHTAIGFDIMERYNAMLKFFESFGYDHEASWLKKRISYLTAT